MAKNLSSSERSVLAGIQDAIKGVIDFSVSSSGEQSNMWKLYYDSEIGSSVEKAVEKMVVVSAYKSLIKFFPKMREDSRVPVAVSRTIMFMLDRSKLLYQYKNGWINETKYYNEIGKRYSSIIVAVIHRGEEMLEATLPRLLESYASVPQEASRYALRKVFEVIQPSEEQIARLVETGLQKVKDVKNKLDRKLTKLWEKAESLVAKGRDWARESVNKLRRKKG